MYFYQEEEKKSETKELDTSLWNLVKDINLVSQPPIRFTAAHFPEQQHHMFVFFFAILEAALQEGKPENGPALSEFAELGSPKLHIH